MDNLRELRMALTNADNALRSAKDMLVVTKAQCEKRAADTGAVNGKNADERDRNMICWLATNHEYKEALSVLRDAEYSRDRAEAILESAKDARRKWEWDIRSKLADALFRQGVQSDHQDYADDGAWDDATDHFLYASTEGY